MDEKSLLKIYTENKERLGQEREFKEKEIESPELSSIMKQTTLRKFSSINFEEKRETKEFPRNKTIKLKRMDKEIDSSQEKDSCFEKSAGNKPENILSRPIIKRNRTLKQNNSMKGMID